MSFKIIPDEQTRHVEIVGFKSEVERVADQIETELTNRKRDNEIIEDYYETLSLPRIRMLLVTKYAKSVKEKFPKIQECKVDASKLRVSYRGSRREV